MGVCTHTGIRGVPSDIAMCAVYFATVWVFVQRGVQDNPLCDVTVSCVISKRVKSIAEINCGEQWVTVEQKDNEVSLCCENSTIRLFIKHIDKL